MPASPPQPPAAVLDGASYLSCGRLAGDTSTVEVVAMCRQVLSGLSRGEAPGAVVVDGCVDDGLVPAFLQVLEQARFDGGGDVGVGFLNLVGHDMAEAECLSDFGDAVVDHPGLVAVAGAVEGQAWFDWV